MPSMLDRVRHAEFTLSGLWFSLRGMHLKHIDFPALETLTLSIDESGRGAVFAYLFGVMETPLLKLITYTGTARGWIRREGSCWRMFESYAPPSVRRVVLRDIDFEACQGKEENQRAAYLLEIWMTEMQTLAWVEAGISGVVGLRYVMPLLCLLTYAQC